MKFAAILFGIFAYVNLSAAPLDAFIEGAEGFPTTVANAESFYAETIDRLSGLIFHGQSPRSLTDLEKQEINAGFVGFDHPAMTSLDMQFAMFKIEFQFVGPTPLSTELLQALRSPQTSMLNKVYMTRRKLLSNLSIGELLQIVTHVHFFVTQTAGNLILLFGESLRLSVLEEGDMPIAHILYQKLKSTYEHGAKKILAQQFPSMTEQTLELRTKIQAFESGFEPNASSGLVCE